MAVMDRFSNGEAYNETVWIERGRFAVRQSGTVRSVANQSPDPTSIVGKRSIVFGDYGLGSLPEEGGHGKFPWNVLSRNLGDFGGILQRSRAV